MIFFPINYCFEVQLTNCILKQEKLLLQNKLTFWLQVLKEITSQIFSLKNVLLNTGFECAVLTYIESKGILLVRYEGAKESPVLYWQDFTAKSYWLLFTFLTFSQ